MRIAIFSDHFYPELGGIQDSISMLARGLAERGHYVDLYVPRYGRQEYSRISEPVSELHLGEAVTVNRLTSISYRGPTLQHRMALPSSVYVRRLISKRPDIVHTNTVFSSGLLGLAAAKFFNIPLISTNHMSNEVYGTYFSRMTLKSFMMYVTWYYNRCDFVSAPAPFIFKQPAGPFVQRPHQVVPNPVDFSVFHRADSAEKIKAKREFGFAGPILVYAGKLAKEKRVDSLLHALALVRRTIPDVGLALAGHGVEHQPLKRLAASLGLGNSAYFLGTISQERLARLYTASEAFVTMSTSEVQSMSMLQARASGLPVASVHSPAWEGVENRDGVLLADREDAIEFAAMVSGLLADPVAREQLGEAASKGVERYSIAPVAAVWEKLYYSVLAGEASENLHTVVR